MARRRHVPLLGLFLTLVLSALAIGPTRAQVSALSDRDLLRAMLSGQPLKPDWFTQQMQDAVPLSHVQSVVDGIHAEAGPRLRVTGSGGRYYLWTGRHRVPVVLRRQADGRIAGLEFHPAIDADLKLAAVLDRLQVLPGRVAILVLRDGEELAARQADVRLAVAGAFKLAVLAALKRQVDDGIVQWQDVVQLKDSHRSLSPGRLRHWPSHAPLTVHTLAAAMLADDDNTATDALIDRLGRDAVATAAGTTRILTTREVFQLKADSALYRRYLNLGPAERNTLLAELSGRLLPDPQQVQRLLQQQAEWHLSARQLCALMGEVLDLDVMRIEPGPADPQTWVRIGFKGGSASGVMNLTSGLVDRRGRRFCATVTWNDDGALERDHLADLYVTLLSTLQQEPTSSAQ